MTLDDWPASGAFHARSAIPGRSLRAQTWTDTAGWPPEWTEITVKAYPRRPSVPLPDPAGDHAVAALLDRRGSVRTPTGPALPLVVLAALLRYSCGLRTGSDRPPDVARRVYPSAGARFPLECYVLANRCAGLAAGAYHYDTVGHRLATLSEADLRGDIEQAFGFPWITSSRAVIVLTAALRRGAIKYADRAYRFALIEAGHVGQNAILVGETLGVPVTPVGGFADEPLNRVIGARKDGEFVLYSLVLP
jgi:SagB-type dehydrogenase family enzyme